MKTDTPHRMNSESYGNFYPNYSGPNPVKDDAVKGSVFLSQHPALTFTKTNFIISAMCDIAHIQVNKVQANFLALRVLTWNIKRLFHQQQGDRS